MQSNGPVRVGLSELPDPELEFVRISVDVDPVHDWCLVRDGRYEPGVLRVRVGEVVARERVAEWRVVGGSRVDVELRRVRICQHSTVSATLVLRTLSPDRTTCLPSRSGLNSEDSGAVHDQVVLPAAMLLPPGFLLRGADSLRCAKHSAKADNNREYHFYLIAGFVVLGY